MALATQWYWLLALAGVIAFAMTTRRLFHIVARKIIAVNDDGRPLSPRQRVLVRYQKLSFHPHFFAWCKTRQDAMFDELPELLKRVGEVRKFLDLGCGFGIAGAYLLEFFPGSEIYGIDPSRERIEAARLAFGDRGHVFAGAAPDFENPALPDRFDAAFSIDMIHYLDDRALDLTLSRIRARLDEGRHLILRAPMQPAGSGSLIWKLTRIHYTAWGFSPSTAPWSSFGSGLRKPGSAWCTHRFRGITLNCSGLSQPPPRLNRKSSGS